MARAETRSPRLYASARRLSTKNTTCPHLTRFRIIYRRQPAVFYTFLAPMFSSARYDTCRDSNTRILFTHPPRRLSATTTDTVRQGAGRRIVYRRLPVVFYILPVPRRMRFPERDPNLSSPTYFPVASHRRRLPT